MSKNLLTPQGDFPAVGLGRRLAAMFYDFLLCTALLIVTGFVYKLIQAAIIGEERLRALTDAGDGWRSAVSTVLLLVLFAFFAKFWTHGGQTLGMQVWGIRAERRWQRDQPVAGAAALRGVDRVVAVRRAWFLWSLFDKQKRTWHDIYSDTRVVRIPKKSK
jgi:uncharacterized RDD family membrane protein YckC